MNNKWIKTLSFLIVLLSLTACSTTRQNEKGNPQRVGGTYEPKLDEAMLAYQQGRLSSAETLYIQYVNKRPKYTEAWFKLGNIYYRTGQYPAAITAYENVIRQTPRNAKAWHNLALTRVKQAEVTLMKAETLFAKGDPKRYQITALKNKIRGGGLRQRTPAGSTKRKVIPQKSKRRVVRAKPVKRRVVKKRRVAKKRKVYKKSPRRNIKIRKSHKNKKKAARKKYSKSAYWQNVANKLSI